MLEFGRRQELSHRNFQLFIHLYGILQHRCFKALLTTRRTPAVDFLSELLPFLWKNASFLFQDNDSGHASEVTAWQKAKGMEVILPD
jgi:hypothetical protein